MVVCVQIEFEALELTLRDKSGEMGLQMDESFKMPKTTKERLWRVVLEITPVGNNNIKIIQMTPIINKNSKKAQENHLRSVV